MIKYLFLFASVFISAGTSAQTYFNQRFEYGQPGWWDGASSICQLTDGYLFGGLYQYFCPHCVGFYKMDFQGNKIISKIYCDDTTEYFLGNGGSIAVLSSDSIVAVGESSIPAGTWYRYHGILFFLNNDLDTLSTKKIGEESEPFDTAYLFTQLKLDPSKNMIIAGIHYPNSANGRANMLLVKTDRKGNLIWKQRYGSGLDYEGYSVICTSDGGYAIGGYAYDVPIPPDYSGDPILVKTDSAGNQQWMLNLGGPLQDGRAMICNSTDGNIIVGTSYCDSMPGGGPTATGNAYLRINIIKVDYNGNILWNKKYGISEGFNYLGNIRENTDGSLIACGRTTRLFPTTYDNAGWMLKTDPQGDSLWYRQYVVCGGETSWNWLDDIIQTDDNGFIAGGIVYTHLPDTGSYDGWVLKVDSLGCENPSYCWVGMKPDNEMPGNTGMLIFPNPAGKFTTINIPSDKKGIPVKMRLYDMIGREMKTADLIPGQTGYLLDVSSWPQGLYAVFIESDGRIIAREKLIVQR